LISVDKRHLCVCVCVYIYIYYIIPYVCIQLITKHRDLFKEYTYYNNIMFLYKKYIIYRQARWIRVYVRKIITPTYNLTTRRSGKKNSINNNNNNKFELLHDAFIFIRMKIIANASHVHVILFLSVILQPARV